ncbi:MAG: CvpA family protein [Proteobacteria bacterium]|nr:CvpA family protein [Pseudomonadota bacterium]
MSELGITFVDLLVVGIVLVSTAYAIYRGFVRETLSILAWAAAAFATLYFGPSAATLLHGVVSPWLAILLGYIGIFLIVLIPLSFLSYRFAENVHHSPVGALDRALGLAFGLVRGLAIIGIVYLVFTLIVPIKQQPTSVRQARLLPLIQTSSEVILSLIPDQHGVLSGAGTKTPQTADAQPKKAAKTDATKHRKKTYGADERRELDRLIQTTGDGKNR